MAKLGTEKLSCCLDWKLSELLLYLLPIRQVLENGKFFMHVVPVKTGLIASNISVESVIAAHIDHIDENTVVVIASKLYSFAEGRLMPRKTDSGREEKWELAKQEADWWIDANESKYQTMLTVKDNWIFANAGIDESNTGGKAYALWPRDPQASVAKTWEFLRSHYGVGQVGVIMSDSRGIPLSWGVTGHGIAHAGFCALRSYIGAKDLFGHEMKMEQVNVMQALAASGAFVMGEGNEGQPIAVLTDIPGITFQDRVPSMEELADLAISMEDDIFAPLLTKVAWKKGGSGEER